ncbi:hypothetical protein [Fulvivirga ligni]|uniref:hypothetical protein n=1 Tax=Fulvivirga ligni TaxID=2904246 RepID=UPI001F1BE5AF|nr:hypothetical protein [Fulvivirga ligni]UII21892.1 hypothetical protein LVD16_01415 [Fulvivirga ligni]
MENPKVRIWILAPLSLSLLIISQLANNLAFLSLLSIAPLFAIFSEFKESNNAPWGSYLTIILILIIGFGCWAFSFAKADIVTFAYGAGYGAVASLAFLIFIFTNKYAKNRLGLFTVIIYWLALEYLLLQINPQFSQFFLGSIFKHDTYLISWDLYTGLQGVTVWILLVNLLFYFALFKGLAIFNVQIRWLSIIYTLIIIVIPFSLNISSEAIVPEDLISGTAQAKQLAGNGEYLGKTAAWVSVLMILYSFVKRKTKDD